MTDEHLHEEAGEEGFALTNDEAFSFREREVETSRGVAKISYIVCEPLEEAGFLNAFSTRLGGVSPLPEESLNLTNFKGIYRVGGAGKENHARMRRDGDAGATPLACHTDRRLPACAHRRHKNGRNGGDTRRLARHRRAHRRGAQVRATASRRSVPAPRANTTKSARMLSSVTGKSSATGKTCS
jgi:hypothetical protein